MENQSDIQAKTKAQSFIVWTSIVLVLVYAIVVLYLVIFCADPTALHYDLHRAILENANGTIGIPSAALCAFFLVWAFPYIANDRISSFKAVGIEFKGVASQVVLWIFAFLSIVASIAIVEN